MDSASRPKRGDDAEGDPTLRDTTCITLRAPPRGWEGEHGISDECDRAEGLGQVGIRQLSIPFRPLR